MCPIAWHREVKFSNGESRHHRQLMLLEKDPWLCRSIHWFLWQRRGRLTCEEATGD